MELTPIMPKEYCWIRSCKNYMKCTPGVDLYPLPADIEERALWVQAFGLQVATSSTRICGAHFKKKYFLKSDGNLPINGGGDKFIRNMGGHASYNQSSLNYANKNIVEVPVASNTNFVYVTFTKDQNADSTCMERSQVPQPKSPIEVVHLEPNKSCLISTEETSNLYCPEALQPLINDSCELFLYCKEENLTPEQQKFQADEWMNYVKYQANIHHLPYISAVKEPDSRDQPPKSVASPELPVLVYSNSAALSKSLEPFVPSSAVSNTPIVGQVPSKVSSPLNINNVPFTQCNIPPVVSNQPSIFPVKLERSVEKSTDKNISEQSNQEEILPFVLTEDGSSLSMLNKVLDPSPKGNFQLSDSSEQIFKNGSSDRCISPELLCSIEVNVEEEADSLPIDENTSNSFCSDLASDNSNGPKIVDVVSGDAGATEFFKDIFSNQASENDSHSVIESGSSSDKNVVYSNESLMPKTVTQFSIFSMQKTIAVISSGTIEANIHNLLGVRQHIPPVITQTDYASKLKYKLREDMFMTLSPWWMIKQRFLPLNPPCLACGGKVFRLNSCYEFLDSLCWTCDNSSCRKIYPVKRPKFFDRFPSFSLEELLLLTYHWACKSRVWIITKDVPVHEERIWGYFTALQELCGNYVTKNGMIGRNRYAVTVEASAVKLGKFFILCAYDRKNKVSRLQALTTEEACGSVKHLRILQQWLGTQCTLITWKKINEDFLPGVTKVAADPTIGNIQSPGRHILNASRYLGKTMVQLFQNICHDELTIESLQGILNEVQWRERVGTTEEAAFWGIMNEISCLNNSYHYSEAIQGEISKDRFFNKADINFRLRWGTTKVGSSIAATIPNSSEKNDEFQQSISKSTVAHIKKMLSPSTPTVSSPTVSLTPQLHASENDLSLHPIRVVGLAPPLNIPKEKDSVSAQELLSIKMTFPGENKREKELMGFKLGAQLKKEGFLTHPIRWLVKNNYIKDEGSCYVCQGKAKLVDNPKFSDGVSWLCQKTHCMFDNRYKRPKFFAYFGFKMDVILATIFHWAVQSDYYTTWKSIPLNHFNIISIHRRLQWVCAEVSGRDEFKIGGKRSLVEVAFVRFSNCFILGAMERETSLSRFRTFSIEAKLHIDEIRKTLISWLRQGSTVVVNSNKYLGRYCMEERINLVFADKTVNDIKSKKYHTLTITNYLQCHIKSMFRNTKSQYLSADLLQVYLDELMWRERYRNSAFHRIMRDIFSVEYGESNFKQISDELLLKQVCFYDSLEQAAAFYGFSLPLPEIKIQLERLPEHVINSYISPDVDTDIDTDEVTIIDHVDVRKEIKVEIISDDDDDENEEIEVDKIEIEAPKTQISPVASTSISSQNDDTELYFVFEKNSGAGTSKSQFFVNKSMSDKSYSRKKKESDEISNWRLQCMECRDTVTVDHFAKPYYCSDCKYNIYSTYCQKAFARHRSFILFGRKFSECYQNTKKLLLPQEWHCICGYSSLEGNELASHLIDCKKTTCYLNILRPSSIL